MKRILVALLLVVFLTGCNKNTELNELMVLRERILASENYSFQANITADYGDAIYSFLVACSFDRAGTMTFEVILPESICGITGTVSREQGTLTFDDQALLFELMADGQITPISAPWIAMNAVKSGYIQSCGAASDKVKAIINDSYNEDALQVEFWFSADMLPVAADISWQNRRILAIEFISFSYM